MDVRSVLQTAKDKKLVGNDFFKAKDYRKATVSYHHVLMKTKALLGPRNAGNLFVPEASSDGRGDGLTAAERAEVNALQADCYNNLAACLLQKEDANYEKVLDYCDKVLEHNPQNAKALYRKAQAYLHLKKYEEALEIFQSLEPDSSVKKYIQLCQKEVAQQNEKLKETYQRMFKS